MGHRHLLNRLMTGLGYLSLPLTIIGVIGLAVTVLKAFTTLSGSWLLLTSISLAACAGGGAGMWLKQRSFRVEAQVSSDNQVRLMVVNTGRRSEFAADVESLTASPDPLKTDVVWGLPWEGYGGGAVREILTDSRRSLLLARVDLRQPNQDSPLNRRGKPVGVVHFNNVGGASPSIFLNDDDAPPGSDFSELAQPSGLARIEAPFAQVRAEIWTPPA